MNSIKHKENHINSLTKLTFVFLVISTAVIAILLLFGRISTWSNEASGAGSLLQGTLGVSVALAGAYVAIRIAQSANNIIENEQRRGQFDFAINKLEQAFALHHKVKMSLEQFQRSALYLMSAASDTIKDDEIRKICNSSKGCDLIAIGKSIQNRQDLFFEETSRSRDCLTAFEDLRKTLNAYLTNPWCIVIQNSLALRQTEECLLNYQELKSGSLHIKPSSHLQDVCFALRNEDCFKLIACAIWAGIYAYECKISNARVESGIDRTFHLMGSLNSNGDHSIGRIKLLYIYSRFQYTNEECNAAIKASIGDLVFRSSDGNLEEFMSSATVKALESMGLYNPELRLYLIESIKAISKKSETTRPDARTSAL